MGLIKIIILYMLFSSALMAQNIALSGEASRSSLFQTGQFVTSLAISRELWELSSKLKVGPMLQVGQHNMFQKQSFAHEAYIFSSETFFMAGGFTALSPLTTGENLSLGASFAWGGGQASTEWQGGAQDSFFSFKDKRAQLRFTQIHGFVRYTAPSGIYWQPYISAQHTTWRKNTLTPDGDGQKLTQDDGFNLSFTSASPQTLELFPNQNLWTFGVGMALGLHL